MTSSGSFVEEKSLILPNLENGPYAIGDLWNCHDSTCIGSNIFGKTLNRDFVEAVPIDHLQYTLSHVKGAKDRMKTLQVAGEVSLELLGGLISGTLGGSYADEQTTSLMEEELQCKYDLVTNNVRTLPKAKEHLNQMVVNSILKGELKATHVVEAEFIGAKVIASIHLKDSKGSEKEDIKGSFMGKLGYGKISLKAKADLCKLDSQTDDQFEVNISLDSKPAPQTQPVSVTEMFKVIEDIMERVKTMTHPAFIQSPQNGSGDGRHIYGIPIRFKLVPITRFLDVQIVKLYRSIHDDTVENFAELLSFLKNIQVHGFLPQRILGSEYRLARLLRDKKNKVTQRIRVREEEFRLLAQDYYKEAVNELKKYKIGKSGYEDLVSLITKINRGVNEPMILEVVEILVEEGREELRAVKLWPSSSDSTPPQTSLTILSNMEHMKEWLPGSGELRVLLRTDRIADFGVVKTLQCISSGLKKIRGIEVGMALPSVSGDGGGEFKLTLQCLRLQSGAHSEHSEEYSTAKDIVFAVRILSFLANEADVNSVKFFGTLLNQMNLKLSSLNSSGSNLLDIIRRLMKYKGITIVDTEVRFQDLCTQKDGRWKLAVTVGAVDSAYENVVYCQKYYERFCGLQMPLDWIIGHFGFESVSQFAEAPVMFVFKDGELKGICLDNFEILLLMEALQTSGDQQEIFFKSYLEANRNRSLRHRSFNAEVSKFALKVAQLFGTRAVDSSEGEHMTLFPPPESDPILSELRNHLRVIVDEAEVQNTAELQLVQTKLASVREMITAKRLAVPSSMKTKLDFYLNNGNLFEETKNSPHDLLRLLNLISKLLTNSGLLALHGCLDAFSSLEDEDATCKLISCFDDERFTQDQTAFLIGSCPKIRLLIERNVTRGRGDGSRNLKVLRELVRVFCVEGVPEYFPESIKQAIEASGVLPRNRGQDAIEVFETIEHLQAALRQIDETGVVPRHFHTALLNTVTENPEIKSILEQSKCLLHWDSQSNNFDELWGHATVQRVLPRLHNFLYNQKVPSSIENVRLSTAVAFFPELKPPQEFQKLQGDHAETTYENPSGLQMGGINVLEKLSGNRPGSSNERIIPKTFMQAGHVLQRPELSKDDIAKDGYMAKIFPFILQRLKMWGAHNIGQVEMASLHPYASFIRTKNSNGSEIGASTSAEPQKSRGFKKKKPEASSMMKSTKKQTAEDKRCPISRLDMLAYLWVNCHGLVFRDLMKILSMFPVSLPLIVPNLIKSSTKSVPGNSDYICLLPLLRDSTFKWKIEGNTDERIHTNQLFQNPFKMIVCVRLGEGKGSNGLGKSTILNQLFKDRATFSCRNDPGAEYGKPLTLDGSVELLVLNENTCSSSLWNEAVVDHYQQANQELLLLANLHGNILQHPEVVQILKRLASYFIVFVMPMSETDLEAYQPQLEEILECGDEETCRFNNRMSLIFVDAEKDILDEYPLSENTHVNTGQLTSDSTLKSVRSSLRNPLNVKSLTNQSLTLTEAEFQVSPALSFVPELIHPQSHILKELIQSQNCAKIKSHLKLQQMNYRSPGVDQEVKKVVETKEWKDFILNFIQILNLPGLERVIAVSHLDSEISQRFSVQSDSIRQEIVNLKEQYRKALNVKTATNQENVIRGRINEAYGRLDQMTLGLEHLYRELGRTYTLTQGGTVNVSQYASLPDIPSKVAELLISGHAIEILDGDSLEVYGPWFNAICHSVCQIYRSSLGRELRVFVLSIIGLQSSGKSTLLNALFSCKFAVSVGRCTRGLFMRMVFLDENLSKDLDVDAIILLDTEGLGAPEKLNDPHAESKDRELATFAMAVSNLTLINVLGESLRDLTDILQIVVITMARLEEAKVSPDIMMVQHVQETDKAKCMKAGDEFCKAIQEAMTVTEKQDMEIGVRNCEPLQLLQKRITSGEILRQFPGFKGGASASAPPSVEYHKAVMELYKDILQSCRDIKPPQQLCSWHDLVRNVWEEVSKQDFALRFKNIKEVQEFISRGKEIRGVKEAVDDCLRYHRDKIILQIRRDVGSKDLQTQIFKYTADDFGRQLPEPLVNCPERCKACKAAEEKYASLMEGWKNDKEEQDTIKTVENYVEGNREKTIRHLLQTVKTMKLTQNMTADFDSLIQKLLSKYVGKKDYSEAEIANMTADIWMQVTEEAKTIVVVEPVLTKIVGEINLAYKNDPKEVAETFRCWRFDNVESMIRKEDNEVSKSWRIKMVAYFRELFASIAHNMEQQAASALLSELQKLPRNFLLTKKVSGFEDGMVNEFKAKVTEMINSFTQKVKFKKNEKWDIHIYSLTQFVKVMLEKEKVWNEENHPVCVLQKKKASYIEEIGIRLQHGFGFQGEGYIIGEKLLETILKLAGESADSKHLKHMKGTGWLLCYENIMLEFYSTLATEVNRNMKERALEFFSNPSKHLIEWFDERVRSIPRDEAIKCFKEVVKAEYESVGKEINRLGSCSAILEYVQNYTAGVTGVEYNPTDLMKQQSENASEQQFDMMKNAIKDKLMKSGKDDCHLLTEKATVSNLPFTHIRDRLGCTASCFWCGALCLGENGHDQNVDETRKHHACHQPGGLRGTRDKNSKILGNSCCHDWADDITVVWHNAEEEMKWREAKTHDDFKNWMFTKHSKSEFGNLMKWFLLQLHVDIAATIQSNPVPEDQLAAKGFHNLPPYHEMIATIKVALGNSEA